MPIVLLLPIDIVYSFTYLFIYAAHPATVHLCIAYFSCYGQKPFIQSKLIVDSKKNSILRKGIGIKSEKIMETS